MDLIRRVIIKGLSLLGVLERRISGAFFRRKLRRKAQRLCRRYPSRLSNAQVKQVRDFWNPYIGRIPMVFHTLYAAVNGSFDVRFIPDDLFASYFMGCFNDSSGTLENKSYFHLLFDCKMPAVAFHRMNGFYLDADFQMISEAQAIENCKKYDAVILKASTNSYRGKNIEIIKCNNADALKEKIESYRFLSSYIVQAVIAQHENLRVMHPRSINTIRVNTLILDDVVHALPPILQMGTGESVIDNGDVGGLACGITPDGHLMKYAYATDGTRYDKHPDGFVFENAEIPALDKVISLVKKQALRLPYNRFVAWDVAVGEDGEPILIEANLKVAHLDNMQYPHGPLFGDLTDRVLQEVFK